MSMKRRQFLKSTVISAGALALGWGCDSEDGADAATPDPFRGPLEDGSAFFPQSVCSGDPKPDRFILWTRVLDAKAKGDVALQFQVGLDDQFKTVHLLGKDGAIGSDKAGKATAKADFDHCVKLRLTGLKPATTYFYRFVLETEGKRYVSRTGRTRTAPAADADVKVRFAVVSCQDYNGKVFNTYRQLAKQEIDFFVHLGDYVYETTGDSSFQDTAVRRLQFSDPASAIVFHAGDKAKEFHAAKSISNYRDMYRVMRTDPDLQRMHERVPMIAIWDDHEFSDDCHGQTATYFDGEKDEKDPARRLAADQAWFEFIPVDFLDAPTFTFDAKDAFPGKFRIYRDFTFGKHVHLVMTDQRRYRSDHIVPEDAFPGAVFLTEAQIKATVTTVPTTAGPYFDVDAHEGGKYAKALKDHAAAIQLDAPFVKGNLSATWINLRIAQINKAVPTAVLVPIPEAELLKMPRGFAWHHLLKTNRYSSLGSRYFVVQEPFEILAKVRWAESKGASEHALGDEQQKWFLDTMQKSTRTWKVWGNELTLTPRAVDLRVIKTLPAAFQARFLLSTEDWDGLPNRRDEILGALAKLKNVVAITGDIHAFFVGTPSVSTDTSQRIVEFVTGAISSGTYKTLLLRQAGSDPDLKAADAEGLAYVAGDFLMGNINNAEKDPAKRPNPTLAYEAIDKHGFQVVEADAKTFTTTFHQIEEAHAQKNLGDAMDDKFTLQRFKVDVGVADVFREVKGAWLKWDIKLQAWV